MADIYSKSQYDLISEYRTTYSGEWILYWIRAFQELQVAAQASGPHPIILINLYIAFQ